jgi:hypothetical protein
MAIVQASIQEEVLPRSERAVIRGIYHASQLSEALVTLCKVEASIEEQRAATVRSATPAIPKETISLMKDYLVRQIASALVSTKLPATSNKASNPQVQTSAQ